MDQTLKYNDALQCTEIAVDALAQVLFLVNNFSKEISSNDKVKIMLNFNKIESLIKQTRELEFK